MTQPGSELHSTAAKKPKAVLVGVILPGMTEQDNAASLAELERLVTTLGFEAIATLWQKRPNLAGGVVLGDGKLRELAKYTGGSGKVGTRAVRVKTRAELRREKEAEEAEEAEGAGDAGNPALADSSADVDGVDDHEGNESAAGAEDEGTAGAEDEGGASSAAGLKADVVVFDCELSPSQLANLQRALGAEVLDRTGVIVEIFSRHARTREARIQVEIARLNYLAPRLRETGGGGDRGGGGGVGGRGAGETALELDRRRIRDRIAEMREELVEVQAEDRNRRQRRSDQNTVALVGYTNAGKSSLMRALTGSEVLVADKLFATLDTTVRAVHPETTPRVLVSDTVGFIKRLPHDLVASFRSTLEEARNASLLLYVVDSSDPSFREQLEVTKSVLAEIGVDDVPSRLILNKSDRLDDTARESLRAEFPEATFLSTRSPEDVAALRKGFVDFFTRDWEEEDLFLPYDRPALVGEARRAVQVVGEGYDEAGVTLRVRAPRAALDAFRSRHALEAPPRN